MQSWISSIFTPVFSVTRSFRNYSNMLIWCLRNISDFHQCWKPSCCLIFFNMIHCFPRIWWIESSKELISLFIDGDLLIIWNRNLCDILNVFTVTFDQFNASLLNINMIFLKKKKKKKKISLTPNFDTVTFSQLLSTFWHKIWNWNFVETDTFLRYLIESKKDSLYCQFWSN